MAFTFFSSFAPSEVAFFATREAVLISIRLDGNVPGRFPVFFKLGVTHAGFASSWGVLVRRCGEEMVARLVKFSFRKKLLLLQIKVSTVKLNFW